MCDTCFFGGDFLVHVWHKYLFWFTVVAHFIHTCDRRTQRICWFMTYGHLLKLTNETARLSVYDKSDRHVCGLPFISPPHTHTHNYETGL